LSKFTAWLASGINSPATSTNNLEIDLISV